MRILIFFLLSACAHTPLNTENCNHSTKSFKCVQYIKNYDGDTITFNIPGVHALIGNHIKIRLKDIETAEIESKNKCEKQKALEAKKAVAKLLKKAKRIDLLNIDRGKYFRIVADVRFDGQDLSKILIKKKLAYLYDGKKKPVINWCINKF